jgi:hypothetical protein
MGDNSVWHVFRDWSSGLMLIHKIKIYADPITPMRHLLPGIAPNPFA